MTRFSLRWLCLALAAFGCEPNYDLPPTLKIRCATNDDCPEGFVCHVNLCSQAASLDSTPPRLDGTPTLTPDFATLEHPLELRFTASEPLAEAPVAVLQVPSDPRELVLVEGDGLNYRFRYVVRGDEPRTAVPVVVSMIDLERNGGDALAAGVARFDTDQPRLVATDLPTDVLVDGARVTLFLTPSEPLASAKLRLGTRQLTAGVAEQDGRLPFAVTIDRAVDAEGRVPVEAELVDVAGNTSGVLRLGELVTDYTPPSLVDRPGAFPRPLRAGERLSLSLTFTEPPGDPIVTMASGDRSIPLEHVVASGLVHQYLHVVAPGEDGEWTFALTGVEDPAGNQGDDVPALAVATVDTTVPRLVDGSLRVTSDRTGGDPFRLAEGRTISIAFETTEPVVPPTVALVFDGGARVDLPVTADPHGASFGASFTVSANTPEGPAHVELGTLVDDAQNVGASVPGQALVIDHTAPTWLSITALVGGQPVDATKPLGLFTSVDLRATASEALARASLDSPVRFGAPTLDGATVDFVKVVLSTDPPGAVGGTLVLEDLAGNQATRTEAKLFTLDPQAPSIEAGSVVVAPTRPVKRGDRVTVTFRASEPLPDAPFVRLGSQPMRVVASGALGWTAERTLDAADVEGSVEVVTTLTDAAANATSARLGTVLLDFTPPTIDTVSADAVLADGSTGRADVLGLGATLRVGLVASEPLATATLDATPTAIAFERAGPPTTEARWNHRIVSSDPVATVDVVLKITDLAGNEAQATRQALARIDPVVPRLASGPSVTPSRAKTGTEVVITYDVTKAPGLDPEVTLAGVPVALDRAASRGAHFVHRTTIDAATFTEGVAIAHVKLRDPAGNGSEADLGSVLIDLTAPALTRSNVTVAPAAASLGQVITVRIVSDEVLSKASLVVRAPSGLAFGAPLVAGNTATWTHVVSAGDGAPPVNVTLAVEDPAGNTASLALDDIVQLDALPPTLTNLSLDRTNARAGDVVKFSFDASEALGATPSVALGDALMERDDASEPPHWVFRYDATGDEAELPTPILVQIVDVAGNRGLASGGSVTYDFTAPDLVEGSIAVDVGPAPGSLLREVSAAGLGSAVQLGFAVTEPLVGDPVLTTAPQELTFTRASATAGTYRYRVTTAADTTEGPCAVSVTLTDRAGNTAVRVIGDPAFSVDVTPPAAVATGIPGAVVYDRAPWGTTTSGTSASYTITGQPNAAEPGATVVVFSDTNLAIARELGRSTADSNGGFGPIRLVAIDRRELAIAQIDAAGQSSSLLPVRDQTWTATIGGKVANSTVLNPHRLESTTRLVAGLRPDSGTSVEVASPGTVATTDGTQAVVTGEPRWVRRDLSGTKPGLRRLPTTVWDPIRGRLLAYGGANATDTDLSEHWEWDGHAWTTRALGTTPGPRSGACGAFDGARGQVLLHGGTFTNQGATWGWDGTQWSVVASNGPPGELEDCNLVWDDNRGRAILWGGRNQSTVACQTNETWEWDGTTWTKRATAGITTRAAWSSAAWDPVRKRMVVFLNQNPAADCQNSAPSVVSELWEWDGSTWVKRTGTAVPPQRYGATLAWNAARARVVAFGGASTTVMPPNVSSELWEYDGTSWTLVGPEAGSPVPAGRGLVALAFDGHRRSLLVWGGSVPTPSGVTLFGDLWEWNGTSWRERTPAAGVPPLRANPSTAWDAKRRRLVFLGGQTTTFPQACSRDLWEWDGDRWAAAGTYSTDVAMRHTAAFAIDPVSGLWWLGAGVSCDYALPPPRDTWSADPTKPVAERWTSRSSSGPGGSFEEAPMFVVDGVPTALDFSQGGYGAQQFKSTTYTYPPPIGSFTVWGWIGLGFSGDTPTSLSAPTAVWDSTRSKFVLTGSSSLYDPNAQVQEVWELAGTTATRVTGTHPRLRSKAAAAFDPLRGRSLLLGGLDILTNAYTMDVRAWNGVEWIVRPATGTRPSNRMGARASWDPVARAVLLFGGGAGVAGNDTWHMFDEPELAPALIYTVDWSASGETDPSILGTFDVEAVVGGRSHALGANGTLGSGTDGATVETWDAWSSTWVPRCTNTAPASAPAPCNATLTAATDLRRQLLANRTLTVRVRPSGGQGNGERTNDPGARVALDSLQFRATYRR